MVQAGLMGLSGSYAAYNSGRQEKDEKRPTGIYRADPKDYGYKKGDTVTVYSLPKKDRGRLCSFSYKKPSPRAERLQQRLYLTKGKLTKLQYSTDIPREERGKKAASLRCQLKYLSCKLASELASLPTNAVIVE